jgi:uncharacterized protein YbjT (DUF2867 family)
MKVVIFGATGMVGQGVLRECLLDPGVEQVLSVGRRATGKVDPKLHELVLPDLTDLDSVAGKLAGYDACFFCLGVTSAGTPEAEYRRTTLDIPAAAGRVLAEKSPNLTFVLVTGRGTDNTGKSSVMWSRVKGEAENAIFALTLKGKYAFRPGIIQPLHGVASRTPLYRFFYVALGWMFPIWRALSPDSITTTERVGRAMLWVARHGYEKQVLESPDINAAAART